MGRGALIAAALALAITGCTQEAPQRRAVATSTPAPSPTPTSVPTPTPEPEVGRPTIDDLLERPFPLHIARAGGELAAPQSTLYAYAQAIEAGANVLQLDVRLTGDDVLVVQRDDTIEDTTGATEVAGPMSELTFEEIHQLDNAYWFVPGCGSCQDRPDEEYIYRGVRTGDVAPPPGFEPDDFAVPTFAQVVQRFPEMPLDIEIRGGWPEGFLVAQVLAEQIEQHGLTDTVVVASADDEVIGGFELIAPDVETSPGTAELTNWFRTDQPLVGEHRIIQVPPELDGVPVLTPLFWEKVERDGLSVWVWPGAEAPETIPYYQSLLAQGVDGVIAGRTAEMAAALL